MERRLAAILAADAVGYSRQIRADEEGTIAAFNALRADIIDPKFSGHRGRIFKWMGDGLLAEFPSVVPRGGGNHSPAACHAQSRSDAGASIFGGNLRPFRPRRGGASGAGRGVPAVPRHFDPLGADLYGLQTAGRFGPVARRPA